MTYDLKNKLAELDLSQADFRRLIEKLSGKKISKNSICNWANGIVDTPAVVIALIELLKINSEITEEIKIYEKFTQLTREILENNHEHHR